MKLTLDKVSLQFADDPLFKQVSLSLGSGDFVLVEGPSGSGKSSLLRLLNRLYEPTSGTLLVDGSPAAERPVTELRRQVVLLQQTPVIADSTVRDNLLLPWQIRAAGQPPGDDRLSEMLHHFLLDELELTTEARPLSVGQKQRLSLIRLLLMEPNILLADEPTSALDPESRQIVEDALVRAHREQDMGVVLVTHQGFQREDLVLRRYRLREHRLEEV